MAFPGSEDVPLRDRSRLDVAVIAAKLCQGCMRDLLSVVLLDLIEAKEGILGHELILQGVQEDLVLCVLGFAMLQLTVE